MCHSNQKVKLGIQGSTVQYNLQQILKDILEQLVRCSILSLDQVEPQVVQQQPEHRFELESVEYTDSVGQQALPLVVAWVDA